jgi:hypothetical protein
MLAVGVHSSAIASGMISTKGYCIGGVVKNPFLEGDFVVFWGVSWWVCRREREFKSFGGEIFLFLGQRKWHVWAAGED